MQFHSTYLQKRQPGISYREFQRLWRSHGDFAATVPAFWNAVERYVHNDPVGDMSGLPNVTSSFDAVGELYYTSQEIWASLRDVMWNEVAPDEKRVFAGAPLSVRGERCVVQQPVGTCKLFTFAKYIGSGTSQQAALALADHLELSARSEVFGRALRGFTVTQAKAGPHGLAMETMPQTASSHDILFIHHFETEGAARAALTSVDYARIQVSESSFLAWSTRMAVLCHGWVLKGEPA